MNTNNDIYNIVRDIYRKVINESDMDWSEIVENNNLDCHPDTLRKAGVGIKMAAEAGVLNFDNPDEVDEYNSNYTKKINFYDQRREYNKLLRADARADYLVNELIKAAQKISEHKPFIPRDCKELNVGECEALLVLSDWHYGQKYTNIWNEYNPDIVIARLIKLLDIVEKKLISNRIKTLHVVLAGDLIGGAIHVANRVQNTEDVVDQLMHVSEIVSEFIDAVSECVQEVHVYCTYGNHSRLIPDLSASIHSDNLERIIPFWLMERFRGRDDIYVHTESTDEIISVEPCGVPCGIAHGDIDGGNSAPLMASVIYQRKWGHPLRYFIYGHFHHFQANEVADIESIGVGSLCGVDEYAKNKRLLSKPSQTLFIFNKDGLDSIHNIDLTNAR